VRPEREALAGPVEVDEGYVGGKEEGVRGRLLATKSIVAVAVEVKDKNSGRLRLAIVGDAGRDALNAFVAQNVVKDSPVKTDGWLGYRGLREIGYRHCRRVIADPHAPTGQAAAAGRERTGDKQSAGSASSPLILLCPRLLLHATSALTSLTRRARAEA